jgi:copper chaperone CopZ
MDDSTMKETARLWVAGMHCDQCVKNIRSALEKMEGIEDLDVTMGSVKLGYYPMAVSLDRIIAGISSLGYSVRQPATSRNPFRRFLDRMTRANQEAFGSEPPSCCGAKKA